MLRSLIWIELCATWWWWLLVLLPFAIARQFNPHEQSAGISVLMETADLNLLWLSVVTVGLGLASGMRDRHGNRDALVRHGGPWRILLAKVIVPGTLMPLYFAVGLGISYGFTDLPVHIGSLWSGTAMSISPTILPPLFLAGLAAGVRRARWWATRLAPIVAVATLITLADGLAPWWWSYEWNRSTDWQATAIESIQVGIAACLTLLAAWWCFAALGAADGEDGPGSRAAAASTIAIALLGVEMAPWLIISDRWEGMRYFRIITRPGADHRTYLVCAMPRLSWAGMARSVWTWSNATTGSGFLTGGPLPGITYDWTRKVWVNVGKGHPDTHVPVIIQGSGVLDGPTTLNDAWATLHLAVGQTVQNRWRNLRLDGGFDGGRVIQAGDHPWQFRGGRDDGDLDYWVMQDDHCSVRPHQGQGEPCRIFQVDSWSGPDPIIRPLTADDPPFLGRWKNLRIGVWSDHLSWNDGRHPEVEIPHPFTSDMDGHVEVQSNVEVKDQPATVIYHWRPTPWSASRWQDTVIDQDGTILAQTELPTAESNPVFRALGILGSPSIAAAGLALNRAHDEATNRPWGSPVVLPWTIVGGVIAATATWWLLARRGVARRSRWTWSVTALLGGVAVPIAALAVWHPAPQRACPSCGRRRWADDTLCPSCGEAWGLPPADDWDVRDDGSVLQKTA